MTSGDGSDTVGHSYDRETEGQCDRDYVAGEDCCSAAYERRTMVPNASAMYFLTDSDSIVVRSSEECRLYTLFFNCLIQIGLNDILDVTCCPEASY